MAPPPSSLLPISKDSYSSLGLCWEGSKADTMAFCVRFALQGLGTELLQEKVAETLRLRLSLEVDSVA